MAFTSTRTFNVSSERIPDMSRALESELRKDGYDTRNDMLLGGDVVVSVTKGGLFKSVIGMRTALKVEIPEHLLEKVPENKRAALRGVLANDPRPRYQRDPARVYAMDFAALTVRFRVEDEVLRVESIEEKEDRP